jgi:hypothetical protein
VHRQPCHDPAFSDYSPHHLLLLHPESFPHGTGACPAGMSFDRYVRVLISRHPREQFAGNVPLLLHVLHAFNILQRHKSNSSTHVTLRASPHLVAEAGAATPPDIEVVLKVLQAGGKGPAVQALLGTATPAARTLRRAYHA